jgi:hypothetical protein
VADLPSKVLAIKGVDINNNNNNNNNNYNKRFRTKDAGHT